jgi:GT2 family glycosyltransferase
MTTNKPVMSVVVTRHKEIDQLCEDCLRSLAMQKNIQAEILFIDQQRSNDMKRLCEKLTNKNISFFYIPADPQSDYHARNFGVKESNNNIVCFCDIDTVLDQNWGAEISSIFTTMNAAIVGTRIKPSWPKKPRWYHKSKYILEFYSMLDVADEVIPISKAIGASFAIDKKLLGKDAFFKESLGRNKGKLLGGGETELCSRALKKGLKIYYTPNATARHQVATERMKIKWLWRRAYFGGFSRGLMGGFVQTFNNTRLVPRDYFALILILPAYILGYAIGKLRTSQSAK